jgi:hypothetical protein
MRWLQTDGENDDTKKPGRHKCAIGLFEADGGAKPFYFANRRALSKKFWKLDEGLDWKVTGAFGEVGLSYQPH